MNAQLTILLVEEYGPKQIDNFEKKRVVVKEQPSSESPDQPSNQTTLQWLDEMLFGWSASKKADEGSQPVSRSEEDCSGLSEDTHAAVGEEGDFDAVVSFVGAVLSKYTISSHST